MKIGGAPGEVGTRVTIGIGGGGIASTATAGDAAGLGSSGGGGGEGDTTGLCGGGGGGGLCSMTRQLREALRKFLQLPRNIMSHVMEHISEHVKHPHAMALAHRGCIWTAIPAKGLAGCAKLLTGKRQAL